MDRVAGMVADWFSLHERLIFQSVSKNISLQLEGSSSAKCGILSKLTVGLTVGMLSNNWEQHSYKKQRNAFAFSEG